MHSPLYEYGPAVGLAVAPEWLRRLGKVQHCSECLLSHSLSLQFPKYSVLRQIHSIFVYVAGLRVLVHSSSQTVSLRVLSAQESECYHM